MEIRIKESFLRALFYLFAIFFQIMSIVSVTFCLSSKLPFYQLIILIFLGICNMITFVIILTITENKITEIENKENAKNNTI